MSRFTRSAVLADEELEARIRASLRRHADDIEPSQPPWSDLVAQAGAVVLPLHGTELPPAHLKSGRRLPTFTGPWVRPTMAAAVALVVAMAGAVIVQRSGDGEAPTSPDAADAISDVTIDGPLFVPPGSAEFDRASASALPFSARLEEVGPPNLSPEILAESYLFESGLGANGEGFLVNPEASIETLQTATGVVQAATVWWSVRDEDGALISEGPVFMRQERDGLWSIVGAYTKWLTVGVNGVQRGDGLIAFTVTDNLPDPTVRVRLNGTEIDLATLSGTGMKRYVETDLAPGEVAVVEVQHMIGDVPASITSMALPPVAVERFSEAPDAPAGSTPSTR